MTCNPDFSRCSIVRLNAELFPVTEFEQQSYVRFGMSPMCIEAAGRGILADAADCDALLVVSESLSAEVIDGLKRCRVISRLGAGTDKIDCEAATRNGILVTNVPGFCAEEQADHTFALLLALVRKLPEMRAAMLAGQWTEARRLCRSIRRFEGRVLGLVGFGASAKAVARRAAGFGLRVMATRRRMDARDDEVSGVRITDLDAVIRQSDYLSLHLPLDNTTFHLMDRQRLRAMKRGAYLVNTSRGALVDETALCECLSDGHLAGAGLDTFQQIDLHGQEESLPKHPLLHLPNVVFTPHVAAYSLEASQAVGTTGVENVAAVLAGKWPEPGNLVNVGVTPRSPLVGSSERI